jgi:hypothetical protein
MTEEGLNDLYEPARAEDLLEGGPVDPMEPLWTSSSSKIQASTHKEAPDKRAGRI